MKNKHSKEEDLPAEETVEQQEIQTEEQAEPQVENNTESFEQKYNELNDSHLRLIAEFDNYRKRTLRDRSELIKTAGESILVNILPLIDDFERGLKAMENTQDIKPVKEGVELIYQKFVAFLTQNGVKQIESLYQPFNVDIHEAITTIPAPSEDLKGKVVDCVSKGYTLNEKVIRFPKVVVGD
jgi:molecular chaperone GrpE